MSSSTTAEPVYLDWEGMLTRRFDLLCDALNRNETALLSAIIAHDQLSHADHAAGFRKVMTALEPSAFDSTQEKLHDIETIFISETETIKKEYQMFSQEMKDLAESPEARDEAVWTDLLNEFLKSVRGKSYELVKKSRQETLKILATMSPEARQVAAGAASRSASAFALFSRQGADWVMEALKSLDEWMQDDLENIQQWDDFTSRWFQSAYDKIKASFPPNFTSHSPVEAAMTHGKLAAKEDVEFAQKMGWQGGYTVVRKGSFWVIQPL